MTYNLDHGRQLWPGMFFILQFILVVSERTISHGYTGGCTCGRQRIQNITEDTQDTKDCAEDSKVCIQDTKDCTEDTKVCIQDTKDCAEKAETRKRIRKTSGNRKNTKYSRRIPIAHA